MIGYYFLNTLNHYHYYYHIVFENIVLKIGN